MSTEPASDGRHLLVLQAGHESPSLIAVDTGSGTLAGRVELADAWLGLTAHPSGEKIYVGGGARGSVWEVSISRGSLRVAREFPLGGDCHSQCDTLIGDVRLDKDGRLLYALDLFRNRVVVVNTQSGLVLGEFRTGAAPYRARLTPDAEHLVISHWGEASLGLYRLSDRRLVERIPVGEHPTDILIVEGSVDDPRAPEETPGRSYPARLFAACAHSDNLWTFGIGASPSFEFLDARSVAPLPSSALGSLPTALGLSHDNRTLYIANSGNNTILVTGIGEALPEPAGVIPTAWFPTAVTGLPDGALAYASGKGDGDHPGLLALLPSLSEEQLEFLTAAAVANLPAGEPTPSDPSPGVQHVALILSDARGAAWRNMLEDSAYLNGYVPAARGQLEQTALLTGGMESDFFEKLGPATQAGRIHSRSLAVAGRAALPAAGTIWSNARQAGIETDVYGLGGGLPAKAYIERLDSGSDLPALAVVRLAGSDASQDENLGLLASAFKNHPRHAASVLFVVPTAGKKGAAVTGGALQVGGAIGGFASSSAILRTVGWLLGLRPMTQLVMAAKPLGELFAPAP